MARCSNERTTAVTDMNWLLLLVSAETPLKNVKEKLQCFARNVPNMSNETEWYREVGTTDVYALAPVISPAFINVRRDV